MFNSLCLVAEVEKCVTRWCSGVAYVVVVFTGVVVRWMVAAYCVLEGYAWGGACVGWMMLLVAFVRVSLGFCSFGFAVLMVLELLPFLSREVPLLRIYNGVGVRLRSFLRSCSLLGAGFLAKNELF